MQSNCLFERFFKLQWNDVILFGISFVRLLRYWHFCILYFCILRDDAILSVQLRVHFFKKIQDCILKSENKFCVSLLTRIIVRQKNQRIHSMQGFFSSFDAPWSQRSWIYLEILERCSSNRGTRNVHHKRNKMTPIIKFIYCSNVLFH